MNSSQAPGESRRFAPTGWKRADVISSARRVGWAAWTLVALALAASGLHASASPGQSNAEPRALQRGAADLSEHYALVERWGGNPESKPLLNDPHGIALSTSGRLYVVERAPNRIAVGGYPSGLETSLGGGGDSPGRFRLPEDAALDPTESRLYVADTGNGRIQVLDALSGAVLAVWPEMGVPRGLATADDGRVFVSDAGAHRILVLDPDGELIAAWGERGRSPGRFETPLGLAISPDGRLVVADHGNQRVQWLDGESGAPTDITWMDNASMPGGAPLDVAFGSGGLLHVAVERAVLRISPAGSPSRPLTPLFDFQPPGCLGCGCRTTAPVVGNQEGVRRVAARPGVGVAFSYAPDLRWHDRLVIYPERGFPRVSPSFVCEAVTSSRHLYDPHRVDAGTGETTAQVLDTTGQLRVLDSSGRPYDPLRPRYVGSAEDIAVDRDTPYHATALSGAANALRTLSLRCFLGCGPALTNVLEPAMMMRRNRVMDLVPDATWWLRAVASDGALSILDAGRGRLIVREGYPCGDDGLTCTDRSCRSMQTCDPPRSRALAFADNLNQPAEPFRAYSDLAYGGGSSLWVLARDGELRETDRFGRRGRILRLAAHTSEALAIDGEGSFFVLGSDGWVRKFDRDGKPRAAWDPELPEPAAGGGTDGHGSDPVRATDLAVDDLGRVLVTEGASDRILVIAPAPPPDPKPHPTADPQTCSVVTDKRAVPSILPLGATTEIRASAAVECPPSHLLRDIVLVFDGSCQMSGARLAAARSAGLALLDELSLGNDRLAVVRFTDELGSGRLLLPLSENHDLLAEKIGGLRNECLPPFLAPDRGAEGRIADGLRAGREALEGHVARHEAGKVLVLLSPSLFDAAALYDRLDHGPAPRVRPDPTSTLPQVSDRTHALREARRLWRSGVSVFSVAVDPETPISLASGANTLAPRAGEVRRAAADEEQGESHAVPYATRATGMARNAQLPTRTPIIPPITLTPTPEGGAPTPTPDPRAPHPPDRGLLAALARPADAFVDAGPPAALSERFAAIGRRIADRTALRSLVIEDHLPANMRYVSGSANPRADESIPGRLVWRFDDAGPDGPPPLRYLVEPLEPGFHPTIIEANAVYTDSHGVAGSEPFPVPWVEVVGPTEATPTSEPTRTSTAVASPEPSPSPSPSPSVSPSRVPEPTPTAVRRRAGRSGHLLAAACQRAVRPRSAARRCCLGDRCLFFDGRSEDRRGARCRHQLRPAARSAARSGGGDRLRPGGIAAAAADR